MILDGIELTNDQPVADGGFGYVYQGTYKGRTVAIKVMKLSQLSETELARRKKVRCLSKVSRSERLTHLDPAVLQRSSRM